MGQNKKVLEDYFDIILKKLDDSIIISGAKLISKFATSPSKRVTYKV